MLISQALLIFLFVCLFISLACTCCGLRPFPLKKKMCWPPQALLFRPPTHLSDFLTDRGTCLRSKMLLRLRWKWTNFAREGLKLQHVQTSDLKKKNQWGSTLYLADQHLCYNRTKSRFVFSSFFLLNFFSFFLSLIEGLPSSYTCITVTFSCEGLCCQCGPVTVWRLGAQSTSKDAWFLAKRRCFR